MTFNRSGSEDGADSAGDDRFSMSVQKTGGVDAISHGPPPVPPTNGYAEQDQKCLRRMWTNHRVDPESLSCED